MTKLTMHGATGRMGRAIIQLIGAQSDLQLVGAVCADSDAALGKDVGELAGIGSIGVIASSDVASSLLGADVVIDFSSAAAVASFAAVAAQRGVGIVCGTTNLDGAAQAALDKAAEKVPVIWAPNTSLGVQVLAELVEQAVRRLGADYDVEIVELHHRNKVDAPSGTARRLADAVRAVRPLAQEVRGRDGDVGARRDDELGIMAVRGGDVVGDHTVYLLGQGERLELSHRASHRGLFANGALRAARFISGRAPGRYRMADVLGS
jgi:4-hydroxy-tetrahydrodipicolinate reductase